MIKWMIKFLQKRGYLVLTISAKKSVYFDQSGQKYAVFKRR